MQEKCLSCPFRKDREKCAECPVMRPLTAYELMLQELIKQKKIKVSK